MSHVLQVKVDKDESGENEGFPLLLRLMWTLVVSLSDDNLDDASSILPPSGVSEPRFPDPVARLAQIARNSLDRADD